MFMLDPVEVVRKHLEVVADHDWDGVRRSMAANADLTLKGVAGWEWEVTTLYRHITQAWDFTVADAQLVHRDRGAVTGMVVLVNGDRRKEVACDYQVNLDRIVSIVLSDSRPTDTSRATGAD